MKTIKQNVKSFFVESCANGDMIVRPVYAAKPIEKGATPVGLVTRLAIAAEIRAILNKVTK